MSVIDLQEKREERNPHVDGPARCGGCGHEWHAVVPQGVMTGLECPECGSMRGMLTHPIESIGERLRLECECGCQLFYVCDDGSICYQCGLKHELKQ